MKQKIYKNAVTKDKADVSSILRQVTMDETLKLSGIQLRIVIYLLNLKPSVFTYIDMSEALKINISQSTKGLNALMKKNVVICYNDIISLRVYNAINKECRVNN